MKTVHELLRENIERWEVRGRGVLTFPERVSPRPPFAPFPGHRVKDLRGGDDGVRHTAVSGFLAKMGSLIRGVSQPPPALPQSIKDGDDNEIEPHWCGEEMKHVELRMRLPEGLAVTHDAVANLLTTMSDAQHPLVFEIIGTANETWTQWLADASDGEDLHRQMLAHFPQVKLSTMNDSLAAALPESGEMAVVEFALSELFMLPLASVKHDPFVTLIGALASLAENELGLYQVIFTPLSEPWAAHSVSAVTKADGRPFFDDGASLVKAAQMKTDGPLFGVVVRLAGVAEDYDRAWQIVRSMAPALRHFSRAGGNEFIPLRNDNYDQSDHIADVLDRQTRRCGMLLNLDELTGLVHLPSSAVQSKKFKRIDTNTRAIVPQAASEGVCIGINKHDGDESEVWLTPEQRVRHCHILGGTGTGKSTLLFSMIQQDIANGEGVAVLDPHGDLIQRVLGIIPPERVKDVVLFDPSDEQFVIPFNILSAHSDFEKQLLASDLVSVWQRLSTSWGDQMQSVMQNAVLAFLESSEGGTLADLRRFLLDSDWRDRFLQTVTDPDVRFYWKRAFPQLGSYKSIGPIITRLETFLSPKPIRYMVSQRENHLDFGAMMDSGKIFLAKLPQGQIGRENAFLLGSLVMTKLQQMAMSRARMPVEQRRPFYCYIDEFHHFITPSLTEILSGARKYGLGLVLASQGLRDMEKDKDVASAVMSNAFTRIVFRVGDSDARTLADGFAHFEARDLQSQSIGQAIARIERADNDFNLSVPMPDEVDEATADEQRIAAIEASRAAYAIPRKEVEAEMLRRLEAEEDATPTPKQRKVKEPVREAAPSAVETDVEWPAWVSTSDSSHAPSQVDSSMADQSPSVVDEPPPVVSRSTGMGRGGQDHQILVEQLCKEGARLGYQTAKEFEVSAGRVDVMLQRGPLRVGVEVAVNSNTSHELNNLRKGLAESLTIVVSVSPLPNVVENIRRAAQAEFADDELARLRFLAPDELVTWLVEQANENADSAPKERRIGGRRVRVKHAELGPEERRRIEDESFAAIAEAIRCSRSTDDQS